MFPPDPCIEAGPVVGLHNPPAVTLASDHTAVVGALSTDKCSHLYPGIEAGPVLGLYNIPALDLASAHKTTGVGALSTGKRSYLISV